MVPVDGLPSVFRMILQVSAVEVVRRAIKVRELRLDECFPPVGQEVVQKRATQALAEPGAQDPDDPLLRVLVRHDPGEYQGLFDAPKP